MTDTPPSWRGGRRLEGSSLLEAAESTTEIQLAGTFSCVDRVDCMAVVLAGLLMKAAAAPAEAKPPSAMVPVTMVGGAVMDTVVVNDMLDTNAAVDGVLDADVDTVDATS